MDHTERHLHLILEFCHIRPDLILLIFFITGVQNTENWRNNHGRACVCNENTMTN